MRRAPVASTLTSCLLAVATYANQDAGGATEHQRSLLLEAYVSTAGPYGQLWTLKLTPAGEAELHVLYAFNPSGSLTGTFSLSEERVSAIRRALEKYDFMLLPERMSPALIAFHMPDLRLAVWNSDKHREVRLYDPKQMAGDPQAKRFLAVWTAVFDGLPVKPTW
jgi:hypothetical protein